METQSSNLSLETLQCCPFLFFHPPLLPITFYVSRLQFPLVTENDFQLIMRFEVIGWVIILTHVSE